MHNARGWMKWIGAAAFALLTTAALAAPQKQFTMTASNASLFRIAVKITNTSPGGNSSFNSLDLDLGAAVAAQGPVTVVHSGTSAPSFTASTSTLGHVRLSGLTPVGRNEYIIVTFGVAPTCPGSVNLSLNATVWTGSSFSGDTFVPLSSNVPASVACDATLACSGSNVHDEPVTDQNETTITRRNDKDPLSPCPPVDVNVVISQSGRTVQIQWDEVAYPNLVLETDTMWPIEAVDDSTTTAVETFPKRTRVAWCPTGDPACTPVFIEAQLCTKNDSPTTSDGLATMPMLPPGLPPPYSTQVPQRARACIISEAYEVKSAAACATAGLSLPCVVVNTIMYVVGDPWLSRQ